MLPRIYRARGGLLTVKDVRTPAGKLRVMEHGGVYQSASYVDERRFELPFEYLRSFDHLFEAALPMRKLLMIGGGGFAYPKHVVKEHEDVMIDVVEHDPAFVRASRAHLFLDEAERLYGERLSVICADGVGFLAGAGTYDAIINDAFKGFVPEETLSTREGARLVKEHLAPGGLYLVNVVEEVEGYLDEVMVELGHAFDHVSVIPATDQELSGMDNYLVVASDADHPFTDVLKQRVRIA